VLKRTVFQRDPISAPSSLGLPLGGGGEPLIARSMPSMMRTEYFDDELGMSPLTPIASRASFSWDDALILLAGRCVRS
jgi:hypothetical protein